MATRHYIMALADAPGCPAGFYHSILLSRGTDVDGDYGMQPWYAGPRRYAGQIGPLPEDGLVLVEKRTYAFDVRAGSPFFYVLSPRFAACLASIKHSFVQLQEVPCVDEAGALRPDRRVLIAVPRKFLQKDCLDPERSRHSARTSLELESIHVRTGFDHDLFDVRDIASSQASLICSEKARQVFEQQGVHGVLYIALSDINHPGEGLQPESLYRPVGLYDPV